MSGLTKRLKPLGMAIGLVAATLLNGACQQRSEESPNNTALEVESPPQGIQPITVPASPSPGSPQPLDTAGAVPPARDAATPLAQEPTAESTVPAAARVLPEITPEAEMSRPTVPPFDPQRLERLEARLDAQQELLDQMQTNLSQQQQVFHALRQSVDRLTGQANESKRSVRRRVHHRSLPAPTLRRPEAKVSRPPPFSVESIDTWGDERWVSIRSGANPVSVRLGEAYAGWTLEMAEGQTVTLRDPNGHRTQLEVPERW